ncbi:MAG: DUF192 domain-containing protein [Treponema sp.]|jgi:uncharacterized membrane protein (UPF0127 family)|nr:DUF192 domain-containing protein [Treponema sp.]
MDKEWAYRWFLFTVFFAAAAFASCGPQKLKTGELRIERSAGAPLPLKVELAKTGDEQARGLMYRKQLPEGEGMLFIFERDKVLSFWMKDTLIPLSIAFIAADGRIIDIKDMQALDTNTVNSSRSVRYALEVPQGWFKRMGVGEGDIVRVDELLRKVE